RRDPQPRARPARQGRDPRAAQGNGGVRDDDRPGARPRVRGAHRSADRRTRRGRRRRKGNAMTGWTVQLEVEEGTSSKFWRARVEGKTLYVNWGKIGTNGQTQVKELADPAVAKREYDKLVAEKRKKGYVDAGGGGARGDEDDEPEDDDEDEDEGDEEEDE